MGILKNEPSSLPWVVKETWQWLEWGLLPRYATQRHRVFLLQIFLSKMTYLIRLSFLAAKRIWFARSGIRSGLLDGPAKPRSTSKANTQPSAVGMWSDLPPAMCRASATHPSLRLSLSGNESSICSRNCFPALHNFAVMPIALQLLRQLALTSLELPVFH